MLNLQFKFKKAVQAVNYFACASGGTIPKLKAIKLLWLADRLHLRNYGRTISGDSYVAMPLGPVASQTLDIINGSSYFKPDLQPCVDYSKEFIHLVNKNDLRAIGDVNTKVFSATDLEAIEAISREYLSLGKYDLSHKISHHFPEWTRFRKNLEEEGSPRKSFDMEMLDFFQDVPNFALFNDQDQDIKETAKELFIEKQQVYNSF